MSCGSLSVRDSGGNLWALTTDNDGSLVATSSTTVLSSFVPPVLASPSFFWQISVGVDGALIATQVPPTAASTSFLLASPNSGVYSLAIADDGTFYTTSTVGSQSFKLPVPPNIAMSLFPNLGLTTSVAGASPLTVGADFSIWSCTLNRFINEDTTNMIVVLDE